MALSSSWLEISSGGAGESEGTNPLAPTLDALVGVDPSEPQADRMNIEEIAKNLILFTLIP